MPLGVAATLLVLLATGRASRADELPPAPGAAPPAANEITGPAPVPVASSPQRPAPWEQVRHCPSPSPPPPGLLDLRLPVDRLLDDLGHGDAAEAVARFAIDTDYYDGRLARRTALDERFQGGQDVDTPARLEAYATALLLLGEYDALSALIAHGPLASTAAKNPHVGATVAFGSALTGAWDAAIARARGLLDGRAAPRGVRWTLLWAAAARYGEEVWGSPAVQGLPLGALRGSFGTDGAQLPFEDASRHLGDAAWGTGGTVSFLDVTLDGWDDVILERPGLPPLALVVRTDAAFVSEPPGKVRLGGCWARGSAAADLDGDRAADLVRPCCGGSVSGPPEVRAVRGRFPLAAGPALPCGATAGGAVALADVDLDGDTDVLLASADRGVQLLRNDGAAFSDVTVGVGLGSLDAKGATAAAFGDVDGDGWADLALGGRGWRRLLRNEGGRFTDVTAQSGVGAGPGEAVTAAVFADMNGDGHLDLLLGRAGRVRDLRSRVVTGREALIGGPGRPDESESPLLFLNDGKGRFAAGPLDAPPLGAMDLAVLDWDNDGDRDLAVGTGGEEPWATGPVLLLEADGRGGFVNRTPLGAAWLWTRASSLAANDYDRDGSVDLLVQAGGPAPGELWRSVLLHNRGPASNGVSGRHSVSIIPVASEAGTNPDAIGARVEVTANGHTQVAEVARGTTTATNGGAALHFGVGAADNIVAVRITWPNRHRSVTTVRDLAVDAAFAVHEDGSPPTLLFETLQAERQTHVIPPGREATILAMLGGGAAGLPSGCTLAEARVLRDHVVGTYGCGEARQGVALRHRDDPGGGPVRTERFAVGPAPGVTAPSAALLAAVERGVRGEEVRWAWEAPADEGGTSPPNGGGTAPPSTTPGEATGPGPRDATPGGPAPLTGRIAFVSDRDGTDAIYAVTLDSHEVERLTPPQEPAAEPTFSPLHGGLAFVADRGGLRRLLLSIPPGAPPKPVPGLTGRTSDPSWSADGAWLVFGRELAGHTDILRSTQTGHFADPVGPADAPTLGEPSAGPTGDRVVASFEPAPGHRRLAIVRADGGPLEPLPCPDGFDASHPAWSPDGTRVAFEARPASGGPPAVMVLRLADGRIDAVSPPGMVASEPAWSPDGALLAWVVGSGAETDIWIGAPGGAPTQLTRDPGSERSPAWEPLHRLDEPKPQ